MRVRWTRWFAALMLATAALLLSACAQKQSMRVALYSYMIAIDSNEFHPGPITVYVTNYADHERHEISIIRTDIPPEFLPRTLADQVKTSLVSPISATVAVLAGETRKQEISLSPGHYVIICNIPGHYDKGMYIDFIVK